MTKAGPTLAARMVLLALAGAIEGLLVSNGPLLERYAALRLGERGLLLDLDLLFALGLAAVGAAAALAPWSHNLFLGLLAVAATWSLSESSTHPFWLVGKRAAAWRPHDPSGAILAAHVLALVLVAGATLLQALHDYRRTAFTQAIPAPQVRRDTRRLAFAAATLLAATTAIAVALLAALDDVAQRFAGLIAGRTAFAVLLGSGLLLLVGIALMASQTKRRHVPAQRETPSVGTSDRPN